MTAFLERLAVRGAGLATASDVPVLAPRPRSRFESAQGAQGLWEGSDAGSTRLTADAAGEGPAAAPARPKADATGEHAVHLNVDATDSWDPASAGFVRPDRLKADATDEQRATMPARPTAGATDSWDPASAGFVRPDRLEADATGAHSVHLTADATDSRDPASAGFVRPVRLQADATGEQRATMPVRPTAGATDSWDPASAGFVRPARLKADATGEKADASRAVDLVAPAWRDRQGDRGRPWDRTSSSRAPVSVTIGRIDVTVEPPPPAPPAREAPARTRGFDAYGRIRRGRPR
jgi:hypothetical protein